MTNSLNDPHAYRFSTHGYNEWRNLAVAVALCSPGDTIVEIGAHIGTETVGFSDILGAEGKVYAFEPLPSNLNSLKETFDNSQYNNVMISPLALGEKSGKVKFVVPLNESTGLAHIMADGEQPFQTIETDCITLDSITDSIKDAKVIFIDAEGSDLNILLGGKNYINKYMPSIVLECYPAFLARAGFTVHDLYTTIRSLNYHVFEISSLGLARIKSTHDYTKVKNWFCVHSSKISDTKAVNKYLIMCGILPCIPGINPMSKRVQ
ncbi:MAG: FkbM family methyltransferase [Candidatus Aenigmarchaeota archaeon]|nr:FkbM family methyltransferase [Candidatus Aenigmarchaeota archaeon]